MKDCPLCLQPATFGQPDGADVCPVSCDRCGEFGITGSAVGVRRSASEPLPLWSGSVRWAWELAGRRAATVKIMSEDLERDPDNSPRTTAEKAERVLRYVHLQSQFPGQVVQLAPSTDYPVGYGRETREFRHMLDFLVRRGDLDARDKFDDAKATVELTVDGWSRVESEARVGTSDGFVAMWFSDEVKQLYPDGLVPAIEAAGYTPRRVDDGHALDKIDDRVIAMIRSSRFVVADASGARPNVYFEAGFAMGLGRPVIWTCREGDIPRLAFDLRQYPHIPWAKPEDVVEPLRDRIIANFGSGPVPPRAI